jgi:hypothetical protein
MTTTHPETKLLIDGEDTSVDELDFDLYQKTKPAEAVQIDRPFQVVTLEGTFEAKAGDYLMRGPAGELYSCDQAIFDDTYGDYHLDGVLASTNTTNVYDGSGGWLGSDEFMWILWTIVGLFAIACVAFVLVHWSDNATKTNSEKQKTRQVQSVACSYDDAPRVCIERTQ